MKKISQILSEAKERTAVLTFGRMSPPTIGHSKLIDHVIKQPGDHHVYVSHSHDAKKNPLSVEDKIDILKKAHPEHKHIFNAASKESPSIFHAAANLHKKGYHHLHVVVGADRVDEFKKSLNDYNGKFNEKGQGYHFKSIKVSSAGDRDPDAEGVEGMSASKMREHAKAGNVEAFKSGLHPNLHKHAKSIMSKVRSGMGLNEEHDPVREAYIEGEIFKVGELVTCDKGTAEIIDRGPNYVTLVKEGQTFKRWLKDVVLAECQEKKRSQIYRESFIVKGYKTKHFTRELAEQFNDAYKQSSDKYALFTAAVCCDKLIGATKEQLIEDFDQFKVEFERASKYLKKFNLHVEQMDNIENIMLEHAITNGQKFSVSQNKIATIIASSIGSALYDDDAALTVNEAVDTIKHSSYSPTAWKILGEMFNKASEAGIQWDKSKFNKSTQSFMELK